MLVQCGYIRPLGRNFRGAGGRQRQYQLYARENRNVLAYLHQLKLKQK